MNQFLQLNKQLKILRMTQKEIIWLQEKRFKSMINFAYRHIPYYHRKFRKHGIHPSDIKSMKDVKRIPITTKDDLATIPLKEWIPCNLDLEKCYLSKTSGSTGTITVTVYDRQAYDIERAITYRSVLSSGVRVTDRMLEFGSITAATLKQKWFQRIGFLQKLHVSILESTNYKAAVAQRYAPDVIYGYPSDLWTQQMEFKDSEVEFHQPRIVMTTGETLSDVMKRDIAEGYGAPVLDQFGCVEMGRTAWECPTHSGYHMNI
ncbi:MAG: phenylacetate--CoA ligase family protein, partial [Candidatus Thorarchaeota archaeon]